MRNRCLLLILAAFCILLTACGTDRFEPTETTATEVTAEQTTPSETTSPAEAETTHPTEAETRPSPYPAMTEEEVGQMIIYFNEVCLSAEITNSGDPSKVQKWVTPIKCALIGAYTPEDEAVAENLFARLNAIPGFPGIVRVEDGEVNSMRIRFVTEEEMVASVGDHAMGLDGTVTFWYDSDEIYDCEIIIRTDIDQTLRNSVILEEIYNGLGPIQDTVLRPDSIIYQEFSQPQALTETDLLILMLLYDPRIRCGMDSVACEAVLRQILIP